MNSKYESEMNVATALARQAGEIMRRYADGDQRTITKTDGSPVTIADTQINRLVIEELAKHFPDDGVVGEEESTAEYGAGRRWICDPVDGTSAYTWGLPTSMFSLGLVIDGHPVLGVAYDPWTDRLYTAMKGEGSFCNGERLAVSTLGLTEGTVAVTSRVTSLLGGNPIVEAIAATGTGLATFSGAVYKSALVARGRFVGYVETGVKPHDMVAMQVIVEEAGGRITGLAGEPLDYSRPFSGAIVSNAVVHDELVAAIERAV